MARRTISIEEKIQKQEQVVAKAKEKYEAASAELNKLLKELKDINNKKLLDAVASSDKSYEEILTFLNRKNEE